MSLCAEHTLVNGSPHEGMAVSLRCKRWSCDICAPFNRKKVVRDAKHGFPNTFITLTANPARFDSPDARARKLVEAWRTVRRRACKKYGYKSIPFICVFERTKKGEPHLHILCRTKWLDQRWLSAQMAKEISAPIVDVRRVTNQEQAACYCAKYLGKDPSKFLGSKRYWRSIDWLLPTLDLIPGDMPLLDTWTRHKISLNEVEAECRRQGLWVKRTAHRLVFSNIDPG